jgi:hypothetical protein
VRTLFLWILMFGLSSLGIAGNPHGAYYSSENNRVFWFIQASDTHIGTSGSTDANNLRWLVNQARSIIAPAFILVTGDLTDSTNGNRLGIPNGPYQEEWNEYKSIVDVSGITPDNYYDIPGNHDAYNDKNFSYYRANSVQGRATGDTQLSFVKNFAFGTYHFLGINTADNTGKPFNISRPYGDHAGLDYSELSFIGNELHSHADSDLTLVFGHHPLFETDSPTDTYVYYGLPEFLSLMDQYYVPLYGYGHTHTSGEAFFIPNESLHEGFFYFNADSLGKASANQYAIMAIDCNGLSFKAYTIGTWPAVLITAPVDANLGGYNPYAYSVPAADSNPIRALVFDTNPVSSVQYRIDENTPWFDMSQDNENSRLWQAPWDASLLDPGPHTIEVRALSPSGTGSHSITVKIDQPEPLIQAGASFTEVGKYATADTFIAGTSFYQGEQVVFRLAVKDNHGRSISGATVQLSITGSGAPISPASNPSNAAGEAEAVWTTSALRNRGGISTPAGRYSATVTGVAASGYAWDGVAGTTTISIMPQWSLPPRLEVLLQFIQKLFLNIFIR